MPKNETPEVELPLEPVNIDTLNKQELKALVDQYQKAAYMSESIIKDKDALIDQVIKDINTVKQEAKKHTDDLLKIINEQERYYTTQLDLIFGTIDNVKALRKGPDYTFLGAKEN